LSRGSNSKPTRWGTTARVCGRCPSPGASRWGVGAVTLRFGPIERQPAHHIPRGDFQTGFGAVFALQAVLGDLKLEGPHSGQERDFGGGVLEMPRVGAPLLGGVGPGLAGTCLYLLVLGLYRKAKLSGVNRGIRDIPGPGPPSTCRQSEPGVSHQRRYRRPTASWRVSRPWRRVCGSSRAGFPRRSGRGARHFRVKLNRSRPAKRRTAIPVFGVHGCWIFEDGIRKTRGSAAARAGVAWRDEARASSGGNCQ